MNNDIYVVIAIVGHLLDVKHCELFSSKEKAFERALSLAKEIAKNSIWIYEDPELETTIDGFSRWIFLETSEKSVIVTCQRVTDCNNTSTSNNCIVQNFDQKDDPFADDLPAGWNRNGIPITMKTFKDNPADVQSVYSLTESQQKALTIARIRKRPNYSFKFDSLPSFNQDDALKELEDNDYTYSYAEDIIAHEIDALDELRCNLIY